MMVYLHLVFTSEDHVPIFIAILLTFLLMLKTNMLHITYHSDNIIKDVF